MNWPQRYTRTRLAHSPDGHLQELTRVDPFRRFDRAAFLEHSARCDFCKSPEAVGAEHQHLLNMIQSCPACQERERRWGGNYGRLEEGKMTAVCNQHAPLVTRHWMAQSGPSDSHDDYFRVTCPSCQHNDHVDVNKKLHNQQTHAEMHQRDCRTCLDCTMGR